MDLEIAPVTTGVRNSRTERALRANQFEFLISNLEFIRRVQV
jgi:hypothetical protein